MLATKNQKSKKRVLALLLLIRAGVDTAEAVDGMDAIVELTWKYSQRVAEVSAHRVVLRHPAYTTLVHPCTAPTAGDKLNLIYDYWQTNPIPKQPNEPKLKRDLNLVIPQEHKPVDVRFAFEVRFTMGYRTPRRC